MGTESAPRSSFVRSHTLRVVDLLSTQVQSVRIELVGAGSSTFTRLGAVLLYLPLLLIGYLLVLAAVMKLLATALGWGLTFFLFGAVHLAISAWGISRGRAPGAAKSYDVVDPQLASLTGAPPMRQAATADTLPDVLARAGNVVPSQSGAAAAAAARAAMAHPRRAPTAASLPDQRDPAATPAPNRLRPLSER